MLLRNIISSYTVTVIALRNSVSTEIFITNDITFRACDNKYNYARDNFEFFTLNPRVPIQYITLGMESFPITLLIELIPSKLKPRYQESIKQLLCKLNLAQSLL